MPIDPEAAGFCGEKLGKLDDHLQTRYIAPKKIAGCSTVVVRKGVTAYASTYGEMDIEAQNVLKELYLCNYYNKQARNALRGIASSTVSGDNILSLKDGESSVTFVNRNEVSKVYRGLAKDSMDNVVRLSAQYNIYQAEPRQLGGIDGSGLTNYQD